MSKRFFVLYTHEEADKGLRSAITAAKRSLDELSTAAKIVMTTRLHSRAVRTRSQALSDRH
jgi:hypothetical protein